MKRTFLLLTMSLFYVQILSSTVIYVPGNQPTIQAGIDAAVNGDTIIVEHGTYFENINFKGKNINVSSLYLLTQDTSHISKTIINGNQNGSVVIFNSGEDSSAILCGITIENGSGFIVNTGGSFGGGIFINNSNPTLLNLIITGNICNEGAGIACINSIQ